MVYHCFALKSLICVFWGNCEIITSTCLFRIFVPLSDDSVYVSVHVTVWTDYFNTPFLFRASSFISSFSRLLLYTTSVPVSAFQRGKWSEMFGHHWVLSCSSCQPFPKSKSINQETCYSDPCQCAREPGHLVVWCLVNSQIDVCLPSSLCWRFSSLALLALAISGCSFTWFCKALVYCSCCTLGQTDMRCSWVFYLCLSISQLLILIEHLNLVVWQRFFPALALAACLLL